MMINPVESCSRTPARPAGLLALLGVLLSLLAPCLAQGQAGAYLPASGDGGDVWVVESLPEDFDQGAGEARAARLLHRGPDELSELGEGPRLPSNVRPGGRAAASGRVWLIDEAGLLIRVRAEQREFDRHWRYERQTLGALPGVERLRGLAAGRDGVAAWVRVDAAAPELEEAEREALDERALLALMLNLPPDFFKGRPLPAAPPEIDPDEHPLGVMHAPDEPPEPAEEQAAREEEPSLAGMLRDAEAGEALLRFRHGRWEALNLPADHPEPAAVWLFAPDWPGELALAIRPAEAAERLHVYRSQPAEDGSGLLSWREQVYEPGWGETSRVRLTLADGHPVAGWLDRGEGAERVVHLALLRRGDARPLGDFSFSPPAWAGWALLPRPGGVELLVRTGEAAAEEGAAGGPGYWRAEVDLRGGVADEGQVLGWREVDLRGQGADFVIMMGVLVAAVLLMLLFWRREGGLAELNLPEGVVLGEFGRRALAGVGDLAVPFALAMLVYRLSPVELLMHWPGRGTATTWQSIEPGLATVLAFVLYVGVGELLRGTTPGKRLAGLRVADLEGRPASRQALLVRNALKSFDLIAWPLLILPLLNPHRQRLGDLVARTVIVRGEPGQDQPEEQEDKDGQA